MRRPLPTAVLLAAIGVAALFGCKGEVVVPGKERVGTFQLISVGLPLSNDCSELLVPDGGVPIDAGVILSVTYNTTTSPDGGHQLPDGGPITPYDAGYLTQVDGSGTEYGVIVGQVFDVSGDSPRVFSSCGCTSIDPPDVLVHERNVLAVLSSSQAAGVVLSDGGCPPLDSLLDGGIPSGPGILPPRSPEGIWNVSVVCGVNLIQVEVLGRTCDAGCVSCSLSNALQGKPGAQ
jgi:hypothetical protein